METSTLRRNSIAFLRNSNLYCSRSEAVSAMKNQVKNSSSKDGNIILSRYRDKKGIKTLAGIIYDDGINKSLSILKVDEVITDFETNCNNNNNNLYYGNLYRNYE